MGAAAGPLAVGTSIAGLGFGVASDLEKGKGDAAALQFEAARARRAAEYGRVRADQTDAQLREELAITLGNIDATRAVANVSSDSPTAMAFDAEQTRVADRERINRVASIRAQAADDEASASYRDYAAREALKGSRLRAAGRVLSGVSPMLRG